MKEETIAARITKLEEELFGPSVDWGEIYDLVVEMQATMNVDATKPESREEFVARRTKEMKAIYGR
ncbi:MAG TPA: hypothetical protein DCR97_11550 [Deltaproteobacteria bacterium]|nr:hypothetical protein [Deltaproteobacteria bacterium]